MIKIRRFNVGDEEGLKDVYYSSIHQVCCRDYSPEQVSAWAPDGLDPQIYINKFRKINPFVATLENSIVGYADLQDDGEIDHFFVHGNHQGKGVGDNLMTEILNNAAELEKLYSEVSHTAKPFFEKYGFKVVKEQQVSINGVKLTNSFMERRQKF